MNSLLKIDNMSSILSSKDGPVFVLNDISLKIKQGQIVGLVGESGSGKTQLSMAFCGMQDLTPGVVSGQIKIKQDQDIINIYPTNQKDLNNLYFNSTNNLERKNKNKFNKTVLSRTHHLKSNVFGWIPQDPRNYLNPFWTIKRLFKETFKSSKNTYNNLEEFTSAYLRQVDIDPNDVFKKYPHELSGGECQRVMIAFVLSKNPQFIIADESTTGLDVSRQKKIISLFKKIKDNNPKLTIILISHDFGFLHHLVDKYLVMYGGYLVDDIDEKEDIKKPENLHPYTNILLSRLWGNSNDISKSRKRYIEFLNSQITSLVSNDEKDEISKLKRKQYIEFYTEKLNNYEQDNE